MSCLIQCLKHSRERFLDRHHDQWRADLFSAETLTLNRLARRLTLTHSRGLTLDAGCGRCTFRSAVLEAGAQYECVDLEPRGEARPTFCADLCNLEPIEEGRYQTVVCHQVLEHIPTPQRAAAEMFRVLRPGGKLIVTVPHLSRYHELPRDYFRYTEHGLSALLTGAGFHVDDVGTYGGLPSFLHHQTSFIFPGLLIGLPLIGDLALLANALPSFLVAQFDSRVGPARLPLGVWGVFSKPA